MKKHKYNFKSAIKYADTHENIKCQSTKNCFYNISARNMENELSNDRLGF